MALRRETEDLLERGRGLFNEGRHYQAHEAWEEAWLEEEGEVRRLLQGLIQVAAGYHKALVQDRPSGTAKLFAAGLEKLAPLPDGFAGLRLDPFRAGVAAALGDVRAWQEGRGGALVAGRAVRLERREPAGE